MIMATLVFKIADVKKVLADLAAATDFQATEDELFDPACFVGGVARNAGGKTEEEAEATGEVFWPSVKYLRPECLGPRIILANSHGIYLLSNAVLPGSPASRDALAYARGIDPRTDADWHAKARIAMGGDDGSMTIPVAWLHRTVASGDKELRLSITATAVKLLNA